MVKKKKWSPIMLLGAIGLILFLIARGGKSEESIAVTTMETPAEETTSEVYESETTIVSVYLCGNIASPGVYEVPGGTLLYQVIDSAGGFVDDGIASKIDMVYELTSNESIYIPMPDEECEGEVMIGGAGLGSEADSGLVNINSASAEQLSSLPGIGEVLADKIVEYRSDCPFDSIEDIMNVSGIGQSKYDKICDLICV